MKCIYKLLGLPRNMREFAEEMRKNNLESVDVFMYRQMEGKDAPYGPGLKTNEGMIEVYSDKSSLTSHYVKGNDEIDAQNKLKEGYKELTDYLNIKGIKINGLGTHGVQIDK